MKCFIIGLLILALSSCAKSQIKFTLLANEKPVMVILPKDIEFYDTSQIRGYTQIHEIRLIKDFYKDSILTLLCPLNMICEIDGKEFFRADHFFLTRSEPTLAVNFHFDPSCINKWRFNETEAGVYRGDTVFIYTRNECNSIELLHSRNEIKENKKYYKKQKYFKNYIKKNRLAHELLGDPYYINALKESGVKIK
ncbi:MAG: hypothetical protein IPH57_03645 [Saprospiraceae bacterium]|nr:hypothetical protein [Saprospiraceae bacterium]